MANKFDKANFIRSGDVFPNTTHDEQDKTSETDSIEIVPDVKIEPEKVKTKETITIENSIAINNTNISVSIDRHDAIKKLVKKSREKDPVQEVLKYFPDMTLNQIVAHFVNEIEDCRLRDMKSKYTNSNRKNKNFKDKMDIFSIPVRPEMKELLKIIDAFYSTNKYILFENLLLELFKKHDFDKDLSEDE